MNPHLDSTDDVSELQTLMGDYFNALLQESAAPVTAPAVPVAAAVPPASAAAHSAPVAAVAPTPIPVVAQSSAPAYQLIRIGGLSLGIPTHCIAAIVAAPPQWSPLSDARTWVLGAYTHGAAPHTVVDTAALLVPGSSLQAVGSIVVLAGQRWALACDSSGEQITPDPAQVNWRGAQGKRPWLAGTVRDPACALLDIPELLRLLEA